MLDALLRSENPNGKLVLTVAVEDAAGASRLHQTFHVKRWKSRAARMLGVQVPDTADWDADPRVFPLTPWSLNLDTGVVDTADRDGRATPLLRWAARAAFQYALTGATPTPANGTVKIVERSVCGACGRPLDDDTSIELGYGPDCENRLFGTRRSRSRTMTGKAQAAA